ncbi:MAG TPA: alpha/beta hydrolase [Thermoanaerobaculia bacterium]|nr:alpha/beta hydrolase [Thermoanaerobaculia bacterium]
MGIRHHVPVDRGQFMSIREQGHGPAVVLLHGIPGSGASWDHVADLLATRCRVLVPDLLGFAASSRSADPETLHARGQAAALQEALHGLQIERATLVGHDFGGPVALSLIARLPALATGLGLLSTNTFPDTPIPFPLSATTWPLVGGLAGGILFSPASFRMMLRQGVGPRSGALDAARAVGDAEQARAIATIFSTSLRSLAELYAPIEHALRSVTVPSFVAWGDRDPFFGVDQGRRTAKALTGARWALLEGAGHFLPEERPTEVASLIAELVDARGGSS